MPGQVCSSYVRSVSGCSDHSLSLPILQSYLSLNGVLMLGRQGALIIMRMHSVNKFRYTLHCRFVIDSKGVCMPSSRLILSRLFLPLLINQMIILGCMCSCDGWSDIKSPRLLQATTGFGDEDSTSSSYGRTARNVACTPCSVG